MNLFAQFGSFSLTSFLFLTKDVCVPGSDVEWLKHIGYCWMMTNFCAIICFFFSGTFGYFMYLQSLILIQCGNADISFFRNERFKSLKI